VPNSVSDGSGQEHEIQQGDCVESLAYEYGHFWQTIWQDPTNAGLRQRRKNPNALLPGDRLFIPPLRLKEVPEATDRRHRFVRKGVPSKLCIILEDEADEPLRNEPYVLEVEGKIYSGTTDAKGKLEHPIPPSARQGTLYIGADRRIRYPLELGRIDPVAEVSGVQGRLNNLGFDCGAADGVLGPETQDALRSFQRQYDLEETGEMDQATLAKLEQRYRS
jgi:N-acetylmuramoyl-L-alanine amidase